MMSPRQVLAVGVSALAVSGCGQIATARTPPLLDERFDGAGLDRDVWRTCHWWARRRCTIRSNDERQRYVPEQVAVRDGRARLTVVRARRRGARPYRSGMLSTGPGPESAAGFAFRYGRVEARVRIPRGDGLWPAFWLLPADRGSEPEIDVMEWQSDEPDVVNMNLHLAGPGDADRTFPREWDGLTPGWHRFGIDWRRGRLVYTVDGRERHRITGAAVPDEPMYLILNLAVSGDPPPTRRTPLPSAFLIDRVTVWP